MASGNPEMFKIICLLKIKMKLIILNLKFVKKINERSLQQHPPTGGVHGATDDGDKTSVVATVKEEGGS